MKTSWAIALLLAASLARADERFDHAGAVGLLIAGGGEYRDFSGADLGLSGPLVDAELGVTFAIGNDGNELVALVRGGFNGSQRDWMGLFGYRGYFGKERLKTILDLGLALHSTPALTLGPRVGFGVQYELSSVIGVFLLPAVQMSFGSGIRFSGEVIAGVQLRSYLLE